MPQWLVGLAMSAVSLCGPVQPAQAKCEIGMVARLPVTMEGARATVPVEANGKATTFWLDSGAFFSFMLNRWLAQFYTGVDI